MTEHQKTFWTIVLSALLGGFIIYSSGAGCRPITLSILLTSISLAVLSVVGYAILASGGRAGEIEREIILRDALQKVWRWHNNNQPRKDFPEQSVKEALKLD